MDKAAIESAKARRHNGHPAIGHESYRRSVAVAANTPEPRMSLSENAIQFQSIVPEGACEGRKPMIGVSIQTGASAVPMTTVSRNHVSYKATADLPDSSKVLAHPDKRDGSQSDAERRAASSKAAPAASIPDPLFKIDSDTHIVVINILSSDGKTVRQLPDEHVLAAYKATMAEQRKAQDNSGSEQRH